MTMFVKGTTVAVVGIKVQIDGYWEVSGLDDEGLLLLGDVVPHNLDDAQMVVENDQRMWVTLEGDEYPDSAVFEARDDGSSVPVKSIESARPMTTIMLHLWKHHIATGQTLSGLREWVDDMTDRAYLQAHGFYINDRDFRLCGAKQGAFQITGYYEMGIETEKEEDGPWAVFGDDLHALVETTVGYIRKAFEPM